ncbi:hypothetical protein ACVWV0_004026 [Ewingella americana]
MTNKKPEKDIDLIKEVEQEVAKLKKCFVIMPIADIAGYDAGHFNRVYLHIIKPACEQAGFTPIRADDINSSNMIVVDILKKIIDSDLAICDLSGRNPNVLYELGLRQAFNKKTVLIKDNKTENIFDVQGFRYAQYDSSLRIDNVKNEITKFSAALKDTFEATGDINSIVQLLQIEPAKIDSKTELTPSDTVLFRAISELNDKVDNMFSSNSRTNSFISQRKSNVHFTGHFNDFIIGKDGNLIPNFISDMNHSDFPDNCIGKGYYLLDEPFGRFNGKNDDKKTFNFLTSRNRMKVLSYDDPDLTMLSQTPVKPMEL